MAQIEKRLSDMGLELPDAPAPVANYIPVIGLGIWFSYRVLAQGIMMETH